MSAQATGTITGVVTDETGALMPGAAVEAISQATGQTRAATSGSDGFYMLPLVPPGVYRVSAALSGFAPLTRDGIRVVVSETARVDFKLKVGQVAENVVVVGEAPLIETGNATLGIVIDEKKVVDLPLNGRNFTQLGTLIPGVVAPAGRPRRRHRRRDAAAASATPPAASASTACAASRTTSCSTGRRNNDTFNTGFVLRPPPDAIQEFKILTHSYSAEYGRNAGSVVNVVTRSGSNTLAGQRLGVPPQRRAGGPELLRPRGPAQARAEPAPVRGAAWAGRS